MQPSEIAAQPASDSLSTSQVLGPYRGVKPFPGRFYHFTVNTNCVNGEIKGEQDISNGSTSVGRGVGGIQYDCYGSERTIRRISVVHVE